VHEVFDLNLDEGKHFIFFLCFFYQFDFHSLDGFLLRLYSQKELKLLKHHFLGVALKHQSGRLKALTLIMGRKVKNSFLARFAGELETRLQKI